MEQTTKEERKRQPLPHEYFFEYVGLDIDRALPEVETVKESQEVGHD